MATIRRRIAHVNNLQTELDKRVHRVNDLVTDLATIDGSASFNDKYIGANAFKTSNALNVKYTDIVNDLTTGGAAVPLSAEQGKTLKGMLDAAATGLVFKGAFDIGTEVAYPATPKTGDFYKIINSVDAGTSVTIGGIHLTQGDSIFFDGIAWFKIDSTESNDILRDGDVSTDTTNFATVDPTKLTDRVSIDTYLATKMAAITIKAINETVTLTGDTATLAHTPLSNVVTMGYAQIAIDDNGVQVFDLVQCTVSGTTLTIAPSTPGEYTGLQATVHYMYI